MSPATRGEPTAVAALRRFPLVARPRLSCAPLHSRLAEIATLVRDAETVADPVPLLAVAHNKAALLASDQQHPDLARELCWQHHRRYPLAPRSEREARFALEPLVNLARLALRHDDPDHAIGILSSLLRGATHGDDVIVDDEKVRLDHSQMTTDAHHAVRTWLWMSLLREGIRGLTAAGRWADARAHAESHRGIGDRLLDGRQVAVIAYLNEGEIDRASELIHGSTVTEPWERAIVETLNATVSRGQSKPHDQMIECYRATHLDERHAFFTASLGLAVIDVAGGPQNPFSCTVIERVYRQAVVSNDAYVARLLDCHAIADYLNDSERRSLKSMVNRSGLLESASQDIANEIRRMVA
ncbi:hypothetical protein [Pseudonocardia sp. HH130630-07]|uniref:hypothetical protein n=1 Tax=Pseudonocardia sp. HH130630-07 TaxID=1690815 RepID=UPI000A8A095D|nr:hypothetical protein [Pseudonocardia sp. HH130630-07]